ncbi:MAG TPA: hypothetical protein VJN70_16435 [Gemmatimonadaceae bacterium]|nr:hypothetical protein [Gemmatimonadaceae bacterium]
MNLRITNLGVTILGFVLAAHAVLALTKKRWVTCLLELIVTVVLFWQQWQLRQMPAPIDSRP